MNGFLWCPVRKRWLMALPEEKIRQALVETMVSQLGYPLAGLAVELGLDRMPHIRRGTSLPRRRADLVVFAKGVHPEHFLYPILLAECKALPWTDKALRQLVGYNQFIGAYFIAAVDPTTVRLGLGWNNEQISFHRGLLPYDDLLRAVHGNFKNQGA